MPVISKNTPPTIVDGAVAPGSFTLCFTINNTSIMIDKTKFVRSRVYDDLSADFVRITRMIPLEGRRVDFDYEEIKIDGDEIVVVNEGRAACLDGRDVDWDKSTSILLDPWRLSVNGKYIVKWREFDTTGLGRKSE